MADSVAVVVGASRGIGKAIATALADSGNTVLATVRGDAGDLAGMHGIEVVKGVDTVAEGGCDPILTALKARSISMLVVAAGSQEVDVFETVTRESIRRQVETNAIGPLFAVKALQPKLRHGAKVVLLSSKNASITETEATGGELYGYRISKVGLNAAGRTLAIDLKRLSDSPVALIHPGVVNTDMLRSLRKQRGVPEDRLTANTMTPQESASRILKLVDGLSLDNSGTYWDAGTGKVMGW